MMRRGEENIARGAEEDAREVKKKDDYSQLNTA